MSLQTKKEQRRSWDEEGVIILARQQEVILKEMFILTPHEPSEGQVIKQHFHIHEGVVGGEGTTPTIPIQNLHIETGGIPIREKTRAVDADKLLKEYAILWSGKPKQERHPVYLGFEPTHSLGNFNRIAYVDWKHRDVSYRGDIMKEENVRLNPARIDEARPLSESHVSLTPQPMYEAPIAYAPQTQFGNAYTERRVEEVNHAMSELDAGRAKIEKAKPMEAGWSVRPY